MFRIHSIFKERELDSEKRESEKQQNTQISLARMFFTPLGITLQRYQCNVCKKEISGKKPANLISHFKINRPDHKEIYFSIILEIGEQHVLVQCEAFIHSAVELVTVDSQPFALLSASGYRNGHKPQLKRFKSAGWPVNLSDEHVYEIKEKVRATAKLVKEKIKSETHHKIVSVMVDSATRNGRSIYGISAQYKHNGILKVVAIGMRELKDSHTANYLAEVLLEILNEYGISLKQVLSITTDNGSNMLAMVREIERILLNFRDDISAQASEDRLLQSQIESAEPSQNDENIDVDIDQFLAKPIENDVLDELLDNMDFYEGLFEKLAADLINQTGNHSLFVNSIKCASHTYNPTGCERCA